MGCCPTRWIKFLWFRTKGFPSVIEVFPSGEGLAMNETVFMSFNVESKKSKVNRSGEVADSILQ